MQRRAATEYYASIVGGALNLLGLAITIALIQTNTVHTANGGQVLLGIILFAVVLSTLAFVVCTILHVRTGLVQWRYAMNFLLLPLGGCVFLTLLSIGGFFAPGLISFGVAVGFAAPEGAPETPMLPD